MKILKCGFMAHCHLWSEQKGSPKSFELLNKLRKDILLHDTFVLYKI